MPTKKKVTVVKKPVKYSKVAIKDNKMQKDMMMKKKVTIKK